MAKLVDGECRISSVSGDMTGLVVAIWVGYTEVSVDFYTGSTVTVEYRDLQSGKTTIQPAPAPAPPAYEAETV
ncbi:hypothetical protein QBC46DRAFT_347335 [Diplogelasinospora grovesii]|uniref:Uncharacterized protein n=1 Tax=Diplogelasinospora grovesii TaxID=303347 RepID=A0AAN6RZQ3_9PEZI|nr:hypothetical protein QBC46DRAFT_347335 [Diplogelasinospora grovesii]